jgi:hypothetical protein
LGHILTVEGVVVDPEIRSFLGFVGYYNRFIKGFSKIARPLNKLL